MKEELLTLLEEVQGKGNDEVKPLTDDELVTLLKECKAGLRGAVLPQRLFVTILEAQLRFEGLQWWVKRTTKTGVSDD